MSILISVYIAEMHNSSRFCQNQTGGVAAAFI